MAPHGGAANNKRNTSAARAQSSLTVCAAPSPPTIPTAYGAVSPQKNARRYSHRRRHDQNLGAARRRKPERRLGTNASAYRRAARRYLRMVTACTPVGGRPTNPTCNARPAITPCGTLLGSHPSGDGLDWASPSPRPIPRAVGAEPAKAGRPRRHARPHRRHLPPPAAAFVCAHPRPGRAWPPDPAPCRRPTRGMK